MIYSSNSITHSTSSSINFDSSKHLVIHPRNVSATEQTVSAKRTPLLTHRSIRAQRIKPKAQTQ